MTMQINPTKNLLAVAKWAFTTRRVIRNDAVTLSKDYDNARAGDLVLCKILAVGQHKNIQLSDRRNALSYPGDLVVLCLGDRYAPDQFLCSAEIDGNLAELAAAGGIVGRVEAAHNLMKAPTKVQPMGLLTNSSGQVMNVSHYALDEKPANETATVLGVFGASMNSGKTTAAVSLAHGLRRAGFSVAGVKVTGTGAFGDFNAFEDAGVPATDFTDVGMATTYKMPLQRIERGFDILIASAASNGADLIVVEIADGVFQKETNAILNKSRIRDRLDGILFAAPDALSAFGGVGVLERYGLSPFAISGMVSCSPLASKEAGEVTGLPIFTREELCEGNAIANVVMPYVRNADLKKAS